MKTAYIYGTFLDGRGGRTERSIVVVEDHQLIYGGPLEDFTEYLDCTVEELEQLMESLRQNNQLIGQSNFDHETYPFPIAFCDISGQTIMPGLVITTCDSESHVPSGEAVAVALKEGEISLPVPEGE